ncbi:hypothetical protein C900_04454 [Fulvivirga imtechensis AK7]|uniref:Uncharacterized protein n=1 Tax=Fulvivirga imtechensis AK7 TaxID=1237149 RepID=L8JLX2_9BACT|nr:hypothetical protein C900_04454 [Fulvivirga imtechensis AK7]
MPQGSMRPSFGTNDKLSLHTDSQMIIQLPTTVNSRMTWWFVISVV